MTTKEQLREKWSNYFKGSSADAIDSNIAFDFFWSEIEKRDEALVEMASSTRRKEMDLKLELFKASERIKELEDRLCKFRGIKEACQTFSPDSNFTSATKCKFCGKEKWEH